MGKIVGNIFLSLFIGGFFDISTNTVYTACYEIIICGLIIGYIVFAFFVIKGVRRGGKYFIGYEWDEPKYGIKKFSKILSWVLLIVLIFGLIYLIGSGIIENIAVISANWLATHLHINGGEAPILEIN